jgi:hypothetical protein
MVRMTLSRPLALVLLGLSLAACGGSTGEAKSAGDVPEGEPVASAPAEPASTSAAASGDGWEGESEAKSGVPAKDEPAPAPANAQGEETRTLEVIQKIVKDHRKPVRECYEKARKDLPTLQGDMIIHFVLDPDGKVKTIELNEQRSTLKAPPVVDCAIKVIKGLSFPPSSRGMETNVNYPYNFMP